MRQRLILILLFSFSFLNLFGQHREEGDLVRLIEAESFKRSQTDSGSVIITVIRKPEKSAEFEHNGATILCDTAYWNQGKNYFDAKGNVKIIQNETTLTSDFIHYDGATSVAQVRGRIVELIDRDRNRLRTHNLDYNTRDSVAHFFSGGSMVSKDSSVIESQIGYYDSKIEMFKFRNKVEMYADSVLIKTDSLIFWGNRNHADFLGELAAWQDSSYLSAGKGWHNRDREEYFFEKKVYIMTSDNEIWSDSLFYKRSTSDAELYSNIQILDTVQSSIIFADYAKYLNDPRSFDLYKNPSVAAYSYENDVADTLFVSGDTIRYKELLRHQVDSALIEYSTNLYNKSHLDPLESILSSKENAKDTLLSKVDSLLKSSADFNNRSFIQDTLIPIAKPPEKLLEALTKISASTADSLQRGRIDSLLMTTKGVINSSQIDSSADDLPIKFMQIDKNVRFYRSDFQGRCDSLLLNSIDSTIRMHIDPVIWNEEQQFTADTIFLYASDNNLRRTELSNNAFVAARQDSTFSNQIKSLDFFAHFKDGELERFDAVGTALALFFIEEDSVLTIMNEKEANAISALLTESKIDKIRSYGSAKSNFHPLADLSMDKTVLEGFKDRDEERPKSRTDVCDRKVLPSVREVTVTLEEPRFPYTKQFFGITPSQKHLLPAPLGATDSLGAIQPDSLKTQK